MADIKNQLKGGIDTAADRAKTATDRVADVAQGAKQEAHGTVDRLKDNAQHMMDKAGDYAGQAREKVSEWAGDASDAAKQAGDKVQKWAGDAYHATSDVVGDFGKEVTALVRKHPIPSILIGFGIGLLLGRTARMI